MAKRFLAQMVTAGDCVIDATAGNGNETLYLANLVGETGCVYAFDIQQQALAATAKKLGTLQQRVRLIHDGEAESQGLLAYVKTLHQADVHVARYELLNQKIMHLTY